MKTTAPVPHRLPLRILLGICLWLSLTASGRVGNVDASVMLDLSRSLWHGSVTLPADCRLCVTGVDGIRTSSYGLAPSVWWMPFVLAGRVAAVAVPSIPRPMWEEFFVSFANVPVIVLLLMYLTLAWRRSGASERQVGCGLILFVLATPLGPYAKLPFSDPLMALAVFAAWYHWTADSGSRQALVAGLWLGVALLSRRQADAIVPVLLLLAGLAAVRRGQGLRLGACLLGLTPLLLARLAYNAARFGSPWIDRQRGNPGVRTLTLNGWPDRLGDLFFSEWSGLLVYSAIPLLIAALALPRMWRTRRDDALTMTLVVVSGIGFLSILPFGPGICFGPRYAIYLIPFLALAWPHFQLPRSPWVRAALGGVLLFSFWLTSSGVALDPVPVSLRSKLLSPPGVAFKAMAGEWRRVLSPPSRPDLPELTANPEWRHDPFQRPDFWWCHLWAQLQHGTLSSTVLEKEITPASPNAPAP